MAAFLLLAIMGVLDRVSVPAATTASPYKNGPHKGGGRELSDSSKGSGDSRRVGELPNFAPDAARVPLLPTCQW
jgi:hypothetical protein